jgi:hypothetical protein
LKHTLFLLFAAAAAAATAQTTPTVPSTQPAAQNPDTYHLLNIIASYPPHDYCAQLGARTTNPPTIQILVCKWAVPHTTPAKEQPSKGSPQP